MIIKVTKEQIIDGRIRRVGEIMPVSSMPEDTILIKDSLTKENEKKTKDFKDAKTKQK